MPEIKRDKSGAVIISYSEKELEENVGYRLMRLEKRVEELERQLKEVMKIVLYLSKEEEGNDKAWGCGRGEGMWKL
jgi:chaperonin cofactor prefoldin